MDSPTTSYQPEPDLDFNLPELDPIQEGKNCVKDRQERPKECSICGREANGYHYDVPSCNGCKTFFRRILISQRLFVCKAGNDCFDLTVRAQPVKCRACRYAKCLAVGMNAEAMILNEQDEQKKTLTTKPKRPLQGEEYPQVFGNDLESPTTPKLKELVSLDNRIARIVDYLTYLELKVDRFRKSSYNPDWKDLPGLEGIMAQETKISISDKVGPMPGWPLKGFEEKNRPPPNLNGTPRGPKYHPKQKSWFYFDLLTTVEYAKTFMFFHQLSYVDRVILLKYSTLSCMNLLVSFYSVQQKFDKCYLPDGTFPPGVKGLVYSKTVMSIEPLIRYGVSSIEYVLLKAICLCNPVVPDLSEHAQLILKRERELYANSLLEYCIRDPKRGPSRFPLLLGIIEILERQQRIQKDLHLLFVSPLVKKIDKKEHMVLIGDIMDN